jgi:hypothetical protein
MGLVAADGSTAGLWRLKQRYHAEGRVQIEGSRGAAIVDELATGPGDRVIRKWRPSAFFRTDLEVFVGVRGIDTLLVTGTSVSGCVRATVTDAFMRDLRCMLVREGVADRTPAVLEANLFDLEQKYADVVTLAEALAYLERFPVAAGVEVLYHSPARQPLHDVLTCIRHGVTLATAGRRLRANAEHDLKSTHAFAALYADDPAAVARTRDVADRCTFSMSELRYRYPSEQLPEGLTSSAWLRRLVLEGARQRWPAGLPAAALLDHAPLIVKNAQRTVSVGDVQPHRGGRPCGPVPGVPGCGTVFHAGILSWGLEPVGFFGSSVPASRSETGLLIPSRKPRLRSYATRL